MTSLACQDSVKCCRSCVVYFQVIDIVKLHARTGAQLHRAWTLHLTSYANMNMLTSVNMAQEERGKRNLPHQGPWTCVCEPHQSTGHCICSQNPISFFYCEKLLSLVKCMTASSLRYRWGLCPSISAWRRLMGLWRTSPGTSSKKLLLSRQSR